MRSRPAPYNRAREFDFRPAVYSFADECTAVAGRMLAYMGCLALLAMAAVAAFNHLELDWTPAAAVKPGWTVADRSYPAFAVRHPDTAGITAAYEIQRHPAGGRKDVLRWMAEGRPVTELELYRLGGEALEDADIADVALRMDPSGLRETVGEGIIDSKFGPVALFGFADRRQDAKRCLGFTRSFEAANLRISGFSCQSEGLPARRAAVACMLDRLMLLTAGGEPKLAELFAHAELKRTGCASGPALSAVSSDWVTGAQNPLLRGSL
ncbi:hypothetical protein RPMA_01850 [Tardiphaga alba]|uniref:Uncharacterized protein n=1 Tax=Tardiphaga alba TaxID=340268 RepID=A0ABX8A5T0_9BRAD|nr:hypothetical protein [Tardiphaga alba]QUS37750.1 hypothetical protein RPMA_01850 [Tardiphaga alba]